LEAVDGIVVEAELDAGDASDRPIPYIRAHVHTHISMHARTNKHLPLLQDLRQSGGRQRRTRGGGGRYLDAKSNRAEKVEGGNGRGRGGGRKGGMICRK